MLEERPQTPHSNRHGAKQRPHDETESKTPSRPRQDADRQWTITSPVTIPMTAEQTQQLIKAWAVLIAAWWTANPPDEQH